MPRQTSARSRRTPTPTPAPARKAAKPRKAAAAIEDAKDTTNGGAPVSLDDLSPEARAQLLEQAKAELAPPMEDGEAAAAARNAQLKALMDPRDHLRHCPMDGRYEAYGDRTPAKPDKGIPAQDVTVVRCIECGGNLIIEEPFAAIMRRLEEDPGEDD